MKNFELLKDYESPCRVIHKGVIKTTEEWKNIFKDLNTNDFEIKKDWFKEVKEKYKVNFFDRSRYIVRINKPIDDLQLKYIELVLNNFFNEKEIMRLK